MKITFLGAAHEVTGSLTYVETEHSRFLIDCGMEQGKDMFVNQELPVNAGEIDFVLLTHAHIDHSGNLPLLYKNGFKGPVYATTDTCNLANIMLLDSAHIQMFEAEYKNRKQKRAGGAEVLPIYDIDDAQGLLNNMKPCKYAEKIRVSEDVEARFTDIGHLLGSACIEVWLTEAGETKKIVFSGDVGNTNQPILRDPAFVESADYVLIESTYGNRLHSTEPIDSVSLLAEEIQKTLDRGGNLVIPSFAVGRTQELLYFMREIKERGLVKGHDGFKVFLDSPLASQATKIFMNADAKYLDDEAKALLDSGVNILEFDGLELVLSSDDSKELNFNKSPKVIISASGMCNAGRIRHHLKHNLWRRECTILFSGYQAEGTLGRLLVEGISEVKLFGEKIAVNAEIAILPGISGHADKKGLINWLSGFKEKPKQIFVNHGDNEVCDEFAQTVNEELGINAFAPYSGTEYDLLKGEVVKLTEGIAIVKTPIEGFSGHENEFLHKFISACEALLKLAKASIGRPNRDLRHWTADVDRIRRDIEQ